MPNNARTASTETHYKGRQQVWEPLSGALARISTAGFPNPDGRALICHAIAERKVRYRWRTFTDDEVLSRVPPETAAAIRDGLKKTLQYGNAKWSNSIRANQWDTNWISVRRRTPMISTGESRFRKRWNFGSDVAPRWSFVWVDVFSTEITLLLSDKEWLQQSKLKADTDHRVQMAREWRERRISRFGKTQRRRREWINFAEIAEWCSELDGSIISSEEAKSSAYKKLQSDLLDGEFDENGRSRVLFLHSSTTMAKMTSSRMRDFEKMFPPETTRSEYLEHCWIPRSLFQRWLATHNLPTEPLRFEPMPDRMGAPRQKTEGRVRGRRGPAPGTVDRFRQADQALYPELGRIMRDQHKSAYAAALALAQANKVQGAGTADSRAKRLAGRFKRDGSRKHTR